MIQTIDRAAQEVHTATYMKLLNDMCGESVLCWNMLCCCSGNQLNLNV